MKTKHLIFKKHNLVIPWRHPCWFQCVRAQLHSLVQLFATPWTAACQAPLSMGFSRQEYWSGLPFPTPNSSWSRDQTCVSCIGRWVFYHCTAWKTRSSFAAFPQVSQVCAWLNAFANILCVALASTATRQNPPSPPPDASWKLCLPVFGINQKLKIQSKSGPNKEKKKKNCQKEMKWVLIEFKKEMEEKDKIISKWRELGGG